MANSQHFSIALFSLITLKVSSQSELQGCSLSMDCSSSWGVCDGCSRWYLVRQLHHLPLTPLISGHLATTATLFFNWDITEVPCFKKKKVLVMDFAHIDPLPSTYHCHKLCGNMLRAKKSPFLARVLPCLQLPDAFELTCSFSPGHVWFHLQLPAAQSDLR